MADFERLDEETIELEAKLREGLRRVDAPVGFAERVLARAEEGRRREARGGWWKSAVAMLLLGIGAGGWSAQRERNERMEAREAQKQFRVAMRISARVMEWSFAEAGRRIKRTTDEGETR